MILDSFKTCCGRRCQDNNHSSYYPNLNEYIIFPSLTLISPNNNTTTIYKPTSFASLKQRYGTLSKFLCH